MQLCINDGSNVLKRLVKGIQKQIPAENERKYFVFLQIKNLAARIGAPIWFDIMKKLVRLR
jgi:hypothetical protein